MATACSSFQIDLVGAFGTCKHCQLARSDHASAPSASERRREGRSARRRGGSVSVLQTTRTAEGGGVRDPDTCKSFVVDLVGAFGACKNCRRRRSNHKSHDGGVGAGGSSSGGGGGGFFAALGGGGGPTAGGSSSSHSSRRAARRRHSLGTVRDLRINTEDEGASGTTQQQQASDSTPMAGETTCATEVKKKTTSPIHPELAAHFERRRNSSSTEKPLADDFGIRDLLKSLAAATEDPKSPKKAGSSSVSSPATTEERISGDAGSSSNRSPEKRRRRKRETHQPTPVRVFSRMYSRCLSDVEGRGKLLRYINKRAAHLLRYFNVGDTRRSDGGGGSPKGGDDSGGDEKEETRLSVDPLELFKTAVVEDQEGEAEELMLYVVILAQQNPDIAVDVLRPVYKFMHLGAGRGADPLRRKCRSAVDSLKSSGDAFDQAFRALQIEADPLGNAPWFIRCGFDCLPVCNSMHAAFKAESGGTDAGADRIMKAYKAQRGHLLWHTAAWNDCGLADQLLRGELGPGYNEDINRRSAEFGSSTPLSVAAINGHLAMVALLLHHSCARPVSAFEFVQAIEQGKNALLEAIDLARISELFQSSLNMYGIVSEATGTPDFAGLKATLECAAATAKRDADGATDGAGVDGGLLHYVMPLAPDMATPEAIARMLESLNEEDVHIETVRAAHHSPGGEMDLIGVGRKVQMIVATWEAPLTETAQRTQPGGDAAGGVGGGGGGKKHDLTFGGGGDDDGGASQGCPYRRYEWRYLPQQQPPPTTHPPPSLGGGVYTSTLGLAHCVESGDALRPGGEYKVARGDAVDSKSGGGEHAVEPPLLHSQWDGSVCTGVFGWLTNHWVLTGVRSETDPDSDIVFSQRVVDVVADTFTDRVYEILGQAEDGEEAAAKAQSKVELSIVDGVASV